MPVFLTFHQYLASVLPMDTPTKDQENPVRFEPNTSSSQVLHFNNKPHRAPRQGLKCFKLLTTQSRLLTPRKKPFENTMRNGENAGNQHSFSHDVFYPIKIINHHFVICKYFEFGRVKNIVV